MYPTLYHLFLDCFGWKIEFLKHFYTLGFFMALAWIISGFIFYKSIKEHGTNALALIAFALFSSFLGTELLGFLESGTDYHEHSGLTYYGGLILAFGASYAFSKKQNIDFETILNAAIIPIILGYGIGRLGCHFSGDGDWGIINDYGKSSWLPDWLWSYKYPGNVLGIYNEVPIESIKSSIYETEYSYQLSQGVFPTSVYEFLLAIIGVVVLLCYKRESLKAAENLFIIGIIYFSVCRFFIEFIRDNHYYDIGISLTSAQLMSIIIVLFSLFFSIRNSKQKDKSQHGIVDN